MNLVRQLGWNPEQAKEIIQLLKYTSINLKGNSSLSSQIIDTWEDLNRESVFSSQDMRDETAQSKAIDILTVLKLFPISRDELYKIFYQTTRGNVYRIRAHLRVIREALRESL